MTLDPSLLTTKGTRNPLNAIRYLEPKPKRAIDMEKKIRAIVCKVLDAPSAPHSGNGILTNSSHTSHDETDRVTRNNAEDLT